VTDYFETRPWRPGDLDLLRRSESLFAPATYPQRFLAGNRRLRPLHQKVSAQLAEAGDRWMGQVALHEDLVVALAECAWDPAELESPALAVNVAQAWQDSGLGGKVLGELVSRCLSLGITTFNLDYAASSTTLQTLADSVSAGTGARFHQSGTTRGGIGLVTVRAAK
jgi:hypothetical protein